MYMCVYQYLYMYVYIYIYSCKVTDIFMYIYKSAHIYTLDIYIYVSMLVYREYVSSLYIERVCLFSTTVVRE